jgi:hypothetical protein
MKTGKILLFLAGVVIFTGSVLFTGSCKKDKEDPDAVSQQSANDNSDAEGTFEDIHDQVDNGYYKAMNQDKGILADCPVVTLSSYDTVTFPKTLTIDFGTGCTGPNGVERKGKIIATLSGKYRDVGTVISVTLDNFYRNGNKIEGSKTITNKGRNTAGHLYFDIVVQNGVITTTDGKLIKWSSSRQREWIEGESTKWPTWYDDKYLVTGSASGVNKEGKNFTITITKPLQVDLNCRYISSGTLAIQTDGDPLVTLDYGNGSCDANATVTINEKTYTIILRG